MPQNKLFDDLFDALGSGAPTQQDRRRWSFMGPAGHPQHCGGCSVSERNDMFFALAGGFVRVY